jgi:hypothetical protein
VQWPFVTADLRHGLLVAYFDGKRQSQISTIFRFRRNKSSLAWPLYAWPS